MMLCLTIWGPRNQVMRSANVTKDLLQADAQVLQTVAQLVHNKCLLTDERICV